MAEIEVHLPVLHPGQALILSQAKRFNVLECGRRAGKTTFGKVLAADALLDGKKVGWFAPTYKVLDDAWRKLVVTLQGVPGFEKNEQKLYMSLRSTGGELEGWSLDTDDPGRSRDYDLVIIDEAALVESLIGKWNSAIRATLADRQGIAWIFGSPKVRGDLSELYALGQSGDPEWMSWHMGMYDNPYIPSAEIASLKRGLPPDDYTREVMGLPTDDGGNPFGYTAIEHCTRESMYAADDPDHQPVVWGWDVARKQDYTVGVGLDAMGNVVRLERWTGLPWGETHKKIYHAQGTLPGWCDSTGVGDPVVERLQEANIDLTPYVFSQRSKQFLMVRLAACIQMGEVTFPKGVMTSELDAFRYYYSPQGGTSYSAPSGLHDDCVCALALALYGYDRVRPYVPAVDIPLNPQQDQTKWQTLVGLLGPGEHSEVEGYDAQLPANW